MAGCKFKFIQILKFIRIILMISGTFFILLLLLAVTTLPYRGYHWLGTSKSVLKWEPQVIIFMGGGGMPSESNLIRCWYVSRAWMNFPQSDIVIAMPGELDDSLSTPSLIAGELIARGVQKERLLFENQGRNTRSQALECKRIISQEKALLLVTSPENMRRTIMSFNKAGFTKVNALPAFENAAEASFRFEDDKLGGNKILIPDVGSSISLRYQLWNHLKYEIIIAREFIALGYYRIRGWI